MPDVEPHIDYDDDGKPYAVWLSAQTGAGLDLLVDAVGELLAGKLIEKIVHLSPDQAALRNHYYKAQLVTHEEVMEEGWALTLAIREQQDSHFL